MVSRGNGPRCRQWCPILWQGIWKTPVHEGFSLALTRDDHPGETYAKTEKDGITYFVDEGDRWFFIGFDFKADFDPEKDPTNVVYSYTPNDELDQGVI